MKFMVAPLGGLALAGCGTVHAENAELSTPLTNCSASVHEQTVTIELSLDDMVSTSRYDGASVVVYSDVLPPQSATLSGSEANFYTLPPTGNITQVDVISHDPDDETMIGCSEVATVSHEAAVTEKAQENNLPKTGY